MLALTLWGAIALDWLLGEPKRYHPLVGFGRYASQLEQRLNRDTGLPRHLMGGLALLAAVLPFTLIAAVISYTTTGWLADLILIYLAIGHRSLWQHAERVVIPLAAGDQNGARHAASMLVSRDPEHLNIHKATIESVLENGSDSIFAALFWFLIAGAPGKVAYRLVNTLDAMWGYRNQRFNQFGWGAARLDDLMNYIPARITALSYCLVGSFSDGMQCWRKQASRHDSPNAGPVMAAGAGSLQVSVGGDAIYGGERHPRPVFGLGPAPETQDILRAMALVRNSLLLWLILITFYQVIQYA